MKKTYLNTKDKENALLLALLAGRLEIMVAEKEQFEKEKDKDLMKNLRMAKTYAYKALDGIMEGLPRNVVDKFLKEAKGREIVVLFKDQYKKKIEEQQAMEDHVVLHKKTLLALADLCMASCDVCEAKPEEVKDCPYRKAMLKIGFEPVNQYAGKNECPYQRKTNEETLERMKRHAISL